MAGTLAAISRHFLLEVIISPAPELRQVLRFGKSRHLSAPVPQDRLIKWGEVRKLTASDGTASDQFGYTVAISGDTIAIGARANDRAKGAASVFERNKGGADNWGRQIGK